MSNDYKRRYIYSGQSESLISAAAILEEAMMQEVNGKWTIFGTTADDPKCIHNVDELVERIDKVGFMPLFSNDIPGFSVEEYTISEDWWCNDPKRDPWLWREIVAERQAAVYGKFFQKKMGFVSKEWFPAFANARRCGYDFDARWDDEKAGYRHKKIMDAFDGGEAIISYELKERAGFNSGEKNFEGTLADLQMQTYLCAKQYRRKINKKGEEYGWSIAVYSKPEDIFGYDYVRGCYAEEPDESYRRIYGKICSGFGEVDERIFRRVVAPIKA